MPLLGRRMCVFSWGLPMKTTRRVSGNASGNKPSLHPCAVPSAPSSHGVSQLPAEETDHSLLPLQSRDVNVEIGPIDMSDFQGHTLLQNCRPQSVISNRGEGSFAGAGLRSALSALDASIFQRHRPARTPSLGLGK